MAVLARLVTKATNVELKNRDLRLPNRRENRNLGFGH